MTASSPRSVSVIVPSMVETVRLFCLRHGESANVLAGAAGALPMAPLTQRGRAQASQAAAALRGERVAGVYASTARRSQQTAEIIATAPGLRPTIMADLDEVGIGELEGAGARCDRRRPPRCDGRRGRTRRQPHRHARHDLSPGYGDLGRAAGVRRAVPGRTDTGRLALPVMASWSGDNRAALGGIEVASDDSVLDHEHPPTRHLGPLGSEPTHGLIAARIRSATSAAASSDG